MAAITYTVLIGLLYSASAILLIYLVSRRRFFQHAFNVLDKYSAPAKPRDKGELRRYKKIKSMISSARKRVFLLFIIHLGIFTLTYIAMIITLNVIPLDRLIIDIPIPIPFISARQNSSYITHVYFIAFIAYMTPLYFFIRAVRPVRE